MSTRPERFPKWRTSTRSNGNGGACVEVAVLADVVGVRDSKNRGGHTLWFTPHRWADFRSTLSSTHPPGPPADTTS